MRIIMAAALLILCTVPGATAQPEGGRPGRQMGRGAEFLRYQAVNLIARDSALARVDVLYRVERSFFVPVRNTDRSIPYPFRRQGEILIELLDSTGASRARAIDEVDQGTATSEQNPDAREWIEGLASFEVPPGRYEVVIELTDLESKRNVVERTRHIRAVRFAADREATSTALFLSAAGASTVGDTLTPVNFGGDVPFGRPVMLYLEVPALLDTVSRLPVTWTISTIDELEADSSVAASGVDPSPRLLRGLSLTPIEGPGARYRVGDGGSRTSTGLLVPLPTQKLPLRTYSLIARFTLGGRERQIHARFRTVWPDMPLSLRDIDRAVDVLRYLVPGKTLDSLRRGSLGERRDKLEAFWKSRGGSSDNAYNELEAEYYRRVDYATRQFGTLKEPDGARTDRGKVFILYGPPTRTERRLDPSAPFQEVWIYEKAGKRFIFVDQNRSGNYTLTSTAPL